MGCWSGKFNSNELEWIPDFEGDIEPALTAMIEALKDDHRVVRICALETVAAFGEKAKDAVPILSKWLDSDDEFSHVSAAGHILMIDPSKSEELIPILVESLASDDFVIQCQAAWLLGQLGEYAEEAVPALKRMLNNGDSFIRWEVTEALQKITGDATDAAISGQSR